jgi:hypothetical protein
MTSATPTGWPGPDLTDLHPPTRAASIGDRRRRPTPLRPHRPGREPASLARRLPGLLPELDPHGQFPWDDGYRYPPTTQPLLTAATLNTHAHIPDADRRHHVTDRTDRGRRRLQEIEGDLLIRRTRAESEGWLGEIEGIDLTLAYVRDKTAQTERTLARSPTVSLGMPAIRT